MRLDLTDCTITMEYSNGFAKEYDVALPIMQVPSIPRYRFRYLYFQVIQYEKLSWI